MRARNIKPGFFVNSKLAILPALARLLFIGLWCMADRRGRLEDDPAKIKVLILPYDNGDPPTPPTTMISTMLDLLQTHGFISRYQAKGNSYIQIVNFEKHQYPHVRESESTIPAPYKHREKRVLARLNTESPILNPESLSTAPNSAVGELIALFHLKQTESLGEKPPKFNGGALGRFLKAALTSHPVGEVKGRIEAYFASTDPFIVSNGYSPTLFTSKFSLLKGGPIHAQTNRTGGAYIGAPIVASKYAKVTENRRDSD